MSSVALALMGAAIWLDDVTIPRALEAWSLQRAPIATQGWTPTAIAPPQFARERIRSREAELPMNEWSKPRDRPARRASEPTRAAHMGLHCAGGIAYSTHTASDGATIINVDPANRCE